MKSFHFLRLSVAIQVILACWSVGATAQVSAPVTTSPTVGQQPRVKALQREPFSHYRDKARGWHFKEPIPDEPEPVKDEAKPPSPPPPAAPASAAAAPGPKPLSAVWIRENMQKYMDAAIDNPTPQNVSNYVYLQRLSIDKADTFAQVHKQAILADPGLDENGIRPIVKPVADEIDQMARESKDALLKDLAKKAGLWFFFKSDCGPCHIQAGSLSNFAKWYGFTVLPVSIDGGALENSPFGKHVIDAGQAAAVGVQYTPSIYLALPPSTLIPVSQNALAQNELVDRIIEIANMHGLLSESQYAKTRTDTRVDVAKRIKSMDASALNSASNPNEVKDYIKSLIQKRR